MNKFMEDELSEQLHGPVKSSVVTVSGGPTSVPGTPLRRRKDVIIYNNGPSTVYVGDENVSDITGIPVTVAGTFALPLARSELYATVSGASPWSTIRVLEAT